MSWEVMSICNLAGSKPPSTYSYEEKTKHESFYYAKGKSMGRK
jgi:hypothetical protein